MSHFAEIDDAGIVLRVIVAEQDFIDSGVVGDPKRWVKTSYNTTRGEHAQGGVPLRKNYAGVGFTYDRARDAFIPPQPFPSWGLNEQAGDWDAPKSMPAGKACSWDEKKQDWVEAVAIDAGAAK